MTDTHEHEHEHQHEHEDDQAVPGKGLLQGLGVTLRSMTKRSVTREYPHVRPELPPRSRGVIALLEETRATGKTARVVDSEDDDTQDVFGATWVLVVSPVHGFTADVSGESTAIRTSSQVRLWTDEYSNLFQILK